MKITLSWLKEYLNTQLPADQIAQLLTKAGLEVDSIEEIRDGSSSSAETVFEISLTPNLGHCSSLIGIARELAVTTGEKVRYPQTALEEDKTLPINTLASVQVANAADCPRYSCRVIKDIAVGPSPEWMKKRLEACGIRSVNNVVDAVNYVTLETGQPLHAFDEELLEGHQIIVRNAYPQEKIVTLDGKERLLEPKDLLICDASKPVALAGVMGSKDSEVHEKTRHLLLESACFAPITIRRTSKRLGLMTDASKRFERGTDPNGVLYALDRAAWLIQQVAGGRHSEGSIDIAAKTFAKRQISCRLSRVNMILGTRLSIGEVEEIFKKLDFDVSWDKRDIFHVTVPTYRNDLREEIDLIEEVARIYGFDNIRKESSLFNASTLSHEPIFLFEREMRARIAQHGLQEFLTCDLIGPTLLALAPEAEMTQKARIVVLNPTSIEQSILRTSLLPGLLQTVKYNWDHQNHDVGAFEIGRIHFKEGERYIEQSMAAIVLSGKSRPNQWDVKPGEYDFFDLKGILENILSELQVTDIAFKTSESKVLHPGRQASLWVKSKEVGTLGEIHPEVLRRLDIPQRILFAEVNLHTLLAVKGELTRMRPLPIYPGSERDWTLTLKEEVPMADLFAAITSTEVPYMERFSLIDIYRSDKLGQGLKNVTLRFFYRDQIKTIEQEKVDGSHAHLIKNVSKSIKIVG